MAEGLGLRDGKYLPFDPCPSPKPKAERSHMTDVVALHGEMSVEERKRAVELAIITRSFLRGAITGPEPFIVESDELLFISPLDVVFDEESLREI